MNCRVLATATSLYYWASISDSKQSLKLHTYSSCPSMLPILCSSSSSPHLSPCGCNQVNCLFLTTFIGMQIVTLNSPGCRPPQLELYCTTFKGGNIIIGEDVYLRYLEYLPEVKEKLESETSMTGGAYDFERATTSLTRKLIDSPKKVTLVRHGLSTWNKESRIQGSSNLSILTDVGVRQAERCRAALADIYFDQCFSSPISRAKSTAEVIWQGREAPLVFLDSLKEANLFFLQGMKNVDARQKYPKEYKMWREDPSSFSVNGVYPLRQVWKTASEAWKEILFTPGENFLVVTHKSILRALICKALGLGPERFRAIDVNNGGISVFKFNERGEAMLQSLNMTAHMYSDHVYLY